MLKRVCVYLLIFTLFLSFPVLADRIEKAAVDASHIVIGKVKKVDSYYSVNEWGDVLILSQIQVKVERQLKGRLGEFVSFITEGGTVGEMTLKVSTYPLFSEGQRVKLYLKKVDHVFRFLRSEVLEEARVLKKPDKKPGGNKCCRTFAHWPEPDVPYYINTLNNDNMSSVCVEDDIVEGATAWNSTSGNISLNFSGNTSGDNVDPSDENIVFFRDEKSGSTIAVTYTWYTRKGKKIVAFDMVFYDGAWRFFSLNCSPGDCNEGFYVQTIATHEFGHAIGIDHNRCKTSIMYPYASYCDTNTELSSDDNACAANLYGGN